MNRRSIFSIAAVVASSPTLLAHAVSLAQVEFESGGLGLTSGEWDVLFGPGQDGQSYRSYALANGSYNVGADGLNGPIFFIERTWSDPVGVPLADAEAEALTLLPADARFGERYNADSARIGYGTQIDRYQSSSLGELFTGEFRPLTKFLSVVIEEIPSTTSMDSNAVRMVIVVGEKPTS